MRFTALLLTSLLVLACNGGTDTGGTTTGGVSATSGLESMTAEGDPLVATYDGAEVRLSELDEEARPHIIKAQLEVERARFGLLEKIIIDALAEKEAAAVGMEGEEWLKQEVEGRIEEVTEEEAKAFFDANPPRGPQTFEQMKPRVMQHLSRQQQAEAYTALTKELKAKYNVKISLEPFRQEVSADDDPFKGPEDAPVTIVEFADFQCGYCARTRDTTNQILEAYPEQVKFVFRDSPIEKHPRALYMAQAANCARDQGKYWEMYDVLFDNMRDTKDEQLKAHAVTLELDAAAFDECYDSGKYAEEVESDMAAGKSVGVSGTPAFFVNGRMISGAQPFEAFVAVIDDELERAGIDVPEAAEEEEAEEKPEEKADEPEQAEQAEGEKE